MTDAASFQGLAALSDMLFQVEQAKLKHIIAREAELRRDIQRVDEARTANLQRPASELTPMRHIGADVQWNAWLGQRRAELNRHLALCLAQKEHVLVALRRSHGRKLAADSLKQDHYRNQLQKRDRKALETDQATTLFRHLKQAKPP